MVKKCHSSQNPVPSQTVRMRRYLLPDRFSRHKVRTCSSRRILLSSNGADDSSQMAFDYLVFSDRHDAVPPSPAATLVAAATPTSLSPGNPVPMDFVGTGWADPRADSHGLRDRPGHVGFRRGERRRPDHRHHRRLRRSEPGQQHRPRISPPATCTSSTCNSACPIRPVFSSSTRTALASPLPAASGTTRLVGGGEPRRGMGARHRPGGQHHPLRGQQH